MDAHPLKQEKSFAKVTCKVAVIKRQYSEKQTEQAKRNVTYTKPIVTGLEFDLFGA